MKPFDKLKHLKKNEQNVFIIHYSCESLNDSNDGYSPRITSIAVIHDSHRSVHSFSIHLIAEIKKINREDIEGNYDKLEGEMLNRFYKFVKENPDAHWLHWNMSNINYGFDAIEHRYMVLSQETPPHINDSRRFDLSYLILDIYGKECVDHPRMTKLMEINGGVHRNVLNGAEEVKAFKSKEYIKLHNSTLYKAYWFQEAYHRIQTGKLVVQRSNYKEKINNKLESVYAKILGFIAILATIYQTVQAFIEVL